MEARSTQRQQLCATLPPRRPEIAEKLGTLTVAARSRRVDAGIPANQLNSRYRLTDLAYVTMCPRAQAARELRFAIFNVPTPPSLSMVVLKNFNTSLLLILSVFSGTASFKQMRSIACDSTAVRATMAAAARILFWRPPHSLIAIVACAGASRRIGSRRWSEVNRDLPAEARRLRRSFHRRARPRPRSSRSPLRS